MAFRRPRAQQRRRRRRGAARRGAELARRRRRRPRAARSPGRALRGARSWPRSRGLRSERRLWRKSGRLRRRRRGSAPLPMGEGLSCHRGLRCAATACSHCVRAELLCLLWSYGRSAAPGGDRGGWSVGQSASIRRLQHRRLLQCITIPSTATTHRGRLRRRAVVSNLQEWTSCKKEKQHSASRRRLQT